MISTIEYFPFFAIAGTHGQLAPFSNQLPNLRITPHLANRHPGVSPQTRPGCLDLSFQHQHTRGFGVKSVLATSAWELDSDENR